MDPADLDSTDASAISVADSEARPQTRDGALLAALREQLRTPDLDWAEPPRPLARGAESIVLDLSLKRLRNEPAPPLVVRLLQAEEPGQVRREAAVQGALAALGFPAPRPIANGEGTPGILQPFLVMERTPGRVLFSLLPALVLITIALFALQLAIVSLLVWIPWFVLPVLLQRKLHGLPVAELERALADRGLDPKELGLAERFARLERQLEHAELRGLKPGLAWLRANTPAGPNNTVLCHGDYWAGNILVGFKGVTGLIDWSNATLAAPEYDLGWSRVQDTGDLPTAHDLGEPWRSRLGALWHPFAWIGMRPHCWLYRRFGSLDTKALDYYTAFHCMRILAWSHEQEAAADGAANLWSSPRARALVTSRFARITGVDLGYG